jgi:hypothetical protein
MARRKRWIEKRDGSAQLSALGMREMLGNLTKDVIRSRDALTAVAEDPYASGKVTAYNHVLIMLDARSLGEFGEERPATQSTPEPAAGGDA